MSQQSETAQFIPVSTRGPDPGCEPSAEVLAARAEVVGLAIKFVAAELEETKAKCAAVQSSMQLLLMQARIEALQHENEALRASLGSYIIAERTAETAAH